MIFRSSKKLKKFSILSLLFFLCLPLVSSAQQDKDTESEEKEIAVYTTDLGHMYEIIGWEADVTYNPFTYTYIADIDPMIVDYDLKLLTMDFDRPPIFGSECLTASDQKACTNEKLQKYVAENFEYPDPAQQDFQEGIQYITFTLDEMGDYEGNLKILENKSNYCEGCQEKAVDIISEMESEWYPAMKDGKYVSTKITLPIKFELINK
jgi:hypothetical protein